MRKAKTCQPCPTLYRFVVYKNFSVQELNQSLESAIKNLLCARAMKIQMTFSSFSLKFILVNNSGFVRRKSDSLEVSRLENLSVKLSRKSCDMDSCLRRPEMFQ
jgi:hypothetical protein